MAPQLIFEEKPHYSIKCDVWSIGVVFYYVKNHNILDYLRPGTMGRYTRHAIISFGIEKTNLIQQNSDHIIQNEKLDITNADIQGLG